MVHVAEAPLNVDHHSYLTTTDHDELLVGWDRGALSSEVVEGGQVKIESAWQYTSSKSMIFKCSRETIFWGF